VAPIEAVGTYDGGINVYKLEGVPGMWHEACLHAVATSSDE
jgi:hypothetical protein